MPSIDTDKLIKEYWDSVKEKYPNFTFEQFEKVCKAPFYFFKASMESKDTPIIHIKYFGKIRLYSKNIRWLMRRNNWRKTKGIINEEEWSKRNEDYQFKLKETIEYEDSKGNKGCTEWEDEED